MFSLKVCEDVEAALLHFARQAAGLGHSSLLFCLGEEECERAVGILKGAGVQAESVLSKLETEEIAEVLCPKPLGCSAARPLRRERSLSPTLCWSWTRACHGDAVICEVC